MGSKGSKTEIKKGCTHVLLRGPRKGQVCEREPVDEQGHCSSCARNYVTTASAPTTRSRTNLPKKIRDDCWLQHHGKKYEAPCYCCGTAITAVAFHCGHIKSWAKGGTDTLDNLVPICASCNLSMGTQDLEEFKQQYYPKGKEAR